MRSGLEKAGEGTQISAIMEEIKANMIITSEERIILEKFFEAFKQPDPQGAVDLISQYSSSDFYAHDPDKMCFSKFVKIFLTKKHLHLMGKYSMLIGAEPACY